MPPPIATLQPPNPRARLSHKWPLQPGGAAPAANLRDPAPPRGSADSEPLPRTPAGPPGSGRSQPATLSSPRPPEPGTSRFPHPLLPQRLQNLQLRLLVISRLPPASPWGGGPHPSQDPEEESVLAWVLRNRFLRDLPRVSRALAEAGEGEDLPPATVMPTGIYIFLRLFPPRDQSSPPPPASSPMWPKSQSFLMADPSPQAPSRWRAKDQPPASASGESSCLLGLLNVRNQTTLIVDCCKRTTLVCNGTPGWQLLTSAPMKGWSLAWSEPEGGQGPFNFPTLFLKIPQEFPL